MKFGILHLAAVSILLLPAGCSATRPQAQAPDPPHYRSRLLDPGPFWLGDSASKPPVLWKSYEFQVDRIPLAARLKLELYHQGSTELARVLVNGVEAGVLSPRWADLSSLDYDIIFFDREDGYSQALDYQAWTEADCWIPPDLLKLGKNQLLIVTARATTDQADDVQLRNIEIEFRYLGRDCMVTDLRRRSRSLPLPYIDRPDPGYGHHPAAPVGLINLNAAGPDKLMRLGGMDARTAARIFSERLDNGPFADSGDLARRVEGVSLDRVRAWAPDSYFGDPEGEPTATALEAGIIRELREIRKLLEEKPAPVRRVPEETDPGAPDWKALAEIQLPDDPTPDQVRQYVADIREATRDQRRFSGGDPQIEMLTRLGPEHFPIILESARRDTRHSYHLREALNRLARPEHKELILEALPDIEALVYIVLENEWFEDAREILIERIRARPRYLSWQWFKSVVSLKDPDTYDDLIEFFVFSAGPARFYPLLKEIPELELDDAVERAWRRAKFGPAHTLMNMVPVAIGYGYPDALELAIRDLDKTTGVRVADARDLVLKFTEARGSDEEIRKWYEENRDRLVFDPEGRRFVVGEEDPAEEEPGEPERETILEPEPAADAEPETPSPE